jgi:hypothetical protein
VDRYKGYQEKEEWYTNSYLLYLFGPEVMTEKLARYMPEPKEEEKAAGVVKQEVLDDGTISAYPLLDLDEI